MSGVKHTPGPWEVRYTNAIYAGSENIADAWSGDIGSPEQAVANARLIAAAPDLMEALVTAKKTIRALHGPDQWSIYDRCSPEMKAINAAITRARGES